MSIASGDDDEREAAVSAGGCVRTRWQLSDHRPSGGPSALLPGNDAAHVVQYPAYATLSNLIISKVLIKK